MKRTHATALALLALFAPAACTSASDVLEPSAIAAQKTQAVPPPPPGTELSAGTAAATPTTPAAPPTPAAGAKVVSAGAALSHSRVQIAPIIGATVETATPLTAELQKRATQRGLTLAGSEDQGATHVLKGYFSALTEGAATTVVYVWDVYDPSGNRLHRINGQVKAASAKGVEGWAAVTPATMQQIADTTIDQFSAWLGGQAG